jgi:hypothetical protein
MAYDSMDVDDREDIVIGGSRRRGDGRSVIQVCCLLVLEEHYDRPFSRLRLLRDRHSEMADRSLQALWLPINHSSKTNGTRDHFMLLVRCSICSQVRFARSAQRMEAESKNSVEPGCCYRACLSAKIFATGYENISGVEKRRDC